MNSKILLVDDDPSVLGGLRRLLECNYDVHVARDGAQALEICDRVGPFALVLSDHAMPGLTGVELLAQLSKRWPATERLLITASTDPDLPIVAMHEARVSHFLRKPTQPQDVVVAVREGVARHQRLEEERLLTEQLAFARETLVSMTETLERRLAMEMRRLRRVEEFGIALAGVQSLETVASQTVEVLYGLLAERPVRMLLAGKQFLAGRSTLRHSSERAFVSEPIRGRAEELGELFVDTTGKPLRPSEQRLMRLVSSYASIAAQNCLHTHRSHEAKLSTIRGLARMAECRDASMAFHHERVAAYSLAIARALREHPEHGARISARFVEDLVHAARLHDIGKVGVPDAILYQRDPLSEAQWDRMKDHTTIGAETLLGVLESTGEDSSLRMAYEIALAHHEHWDGGGYPRGLKGDAIPLPARIVAVADGYDALTSERPYKKAWAHARAVEELRSRRATVYDPDVVDAFLLAEDELDRLREELRLALANRAADAIRPHAS